MGPRRPLINEDSITACVFAAVVLTLAIVSICRWTISSKSISEEEKRRFASCPHLALNWQSIAAFPAGFDAFYNDRFTGRQTLLATINFLKYKAFRYSSSPKVVAGKHDWLFYLDGGDEETLRNWPPLRREELEEWVKYFEARRAWLAQRNIRYLVLIAPSKSTIYPEYVPAGYRPLSKRSRLDELYDALKASTRVEFVDARPALKKAKPYARLYFKTDTHWNPVGAYFAYCETIKYLNRWYPNTEILKPSALNIDPYCFSTGDLADMAGLHGLLRDRTLQVHLKNQHWSFSKHPRPPDLTDDAHRREPFATEITDQRLPKAVCLRDSYMAIPQMYFSENFCRIAYQWRWDFPIDVIEQEKPDIVIQEFLERGLARGIPPNPPEVERCAQVQLFASRPKHTTLAQTKTSPTN
jgi:hypothetical protein